MPLSYLDDWEMDFEIVPASLKAKDRVLEEEEVMGEIQTVTQLFPEFFVANKDKYLAEVLKIRGHHPDEYAPAAQLPPQPPEDDIAESMSYKDAPPSIRRQMEKKAGFEPATETEVSPNAPEAPADDILAKLHE